MITQAIIEMKQKKGSSRPAILKHIAEATNTVPNALLVKKTVKKMVEEGILVPGAEAGKSGSGSFKVSPTEKLLLQEIYSRNVRALNYADVISSDLKSFSHHDLAFIKSESDACRENSRNLRLSVLTKS